MMATTHAFVGAALACLTVFVAPGAAPAAITAGFVGGLLPDLDMVFVHRRTLHFPVIAPLVAILALALAMLVPSTATIALSALAAGASVHPLMDVFGGSAEPRPWRRTTDRAVYDHVRGRWLRARRWIRFDGSPEDLGVAAFASAPVLTVSTGPLQDLAMSVLVVSICYTLVRRHVVELYATVVDHLPHVVRARLPERELPTGDRD